MSTVLIAIEAGGALDGANLLASDGKKAQEILLPSRLLVDVPGQGSAQLSAAPSSGPGAASAAVENALHVRIDGTWVLDPATLAALVDAEGGVDVTLTDDVLPNDGSTTSTDPGIIDQLPSGRLYKDGNILEDSKSRAVVERRRMGFAGCAFVAIAVTEKGELADDPEVDLVGIPEKNAAGEVIDEIVFDVVVSTVESLPKARRAIRTRWRNWFAARCVP